MKSRFKQAQIYRKAAQAEAIRPVIESLEARKMLSISVPTMNTPIIYTIPNTPIKTTQVNGIVSSLSPQMMRTAYGFNGVYFKDTTTGETVLGNGAGQTIAMVDAYGDPTILTDLAAFDAKWGISDTDSSGNFALTVEAPFGGPTSVNQGWGLETALDVEWAHAIAPAAHIDLIVAPDSSGLNLFKCDTFAAEQPGINVVSNSWGGGEFADEIFLDPDFTTPVGHSPVMFLFSSGDDNVQEYPATSPNVLSVGGTELDVDSSGNYEGETPWIGSGGGPSGIEGTDAPLVSYDSDPDTGVWVYDASVGGWIPHIGGTSIACPQWAGLIAIANQGRAIAGEPSAALSDVQNIINNDPSDFRAIGGIPFPFNLFGFVRNVGVGTPKVPQFVNDLVGDGVTGSSTGDHLVFLQQPTTATAGTIIPSFSVALENGAGQLVNTSGIQVSLLIEQGPLNGEGSFQTVNSGTINGVATFPIQALNVAGTYRFEAVDPSDIPAVSNTFTVTPAAATKLVFLTEPGPAWQFGPVLPGFKLGLEDEFGNLVTTNHSRVTLTLNSGPATRAIGTSSVRASGGVAFFTNYAVNTAGTYTLLASDGALAQTVSSSYQVVAPPASMETFLYSGLRLTSGFQLLQEKRLGLELARQGPPSILLLS